MIICIPVPAYNQKRYRDGDTYFSKGVLAAYRFISRCFEWKVQRFCWSKGTSLVCAESIYVKITETECVSDELWHNAV